MSVKNKFLFPMVLIAVVAVIASSAIFILNVVQFIRFVDANIEAELQRAANLIRIEVEDRQSRSEMAVLLFVNDSVLRTSMIESDYETARRRTLEIFEQVDVELAGLINTDAIRVIRAQDPTHYGDCNRGVLYVTMALDGYLDGGFMSGIGRGVTTLSTRTIGNIYDDNGNIAGVLLVGYRLDNDPFVDRLRQFTGTEISVYVNDMRIATTLTNEDGTRAVSDEGEGGRRYTLPVFAEEDAIELIRFKNYNLATIQVPLFAAITNEVAGVVSAGIFLTDRDAVISSFITVGLLIMLAFLAVSAGFLIYLSRFVVAPIDKEIDKANFDMLMGIPNRRYFDINMAQILQTLSRSHGTLSLMMIDIDYFKKFNDTYGHLKGDECLKAIAQVLKSIVTRSDDFVARYGGEEFVAVLPNTDKRGAKTIAEKLLENVRNLQIPHSQSDVSDHLTVSIGLVTASVTHTQRADHFISRADKLLYKSKQSGRNRCTS